MSGGTVAGWVPPDGGYGWVIAVSCMFVMLFAAQSFVDFGIFLLAFIEYFDASTTVVSIVGAIQMSASGFCCLMWSPIVHKLGSRFSLIAGALLVGTGYLLSVPMPHVYCLFLTYGILPGMGFAAYYMVAAVHVQFYFDRRRALAVSLMMTGLSVGSFFWPLSSHWLISHYGWRGAVVIQAALHLHLVPLALLLRPPAISTLTLHTCNVLPQQHAMYPIPSTGDDFSANDLQQPHRLAPVQESGKDSRGGAENPDSQQQLTGNGDTCKSDEQANERESVKRISKEIPLLNSTTQQQEQQKIENDHQQHSSVIGKGSSSSQWQQMVELMRQPAMMAYCVAVYFVHQGHLGVLTFLSVRGLGVGATAAKAAFLLSIAALFNGSLRILFGYLGDRFGHLRLFMYGCSALCAGLLTLVSITFDSYALLACYAAGWGVVASCYIALQNTIPMDLVGRERAPLAVACVWFFTGIAYLTSYPLSGFLLDNDPTAKTFCYVQGIPQVIGGALLPLVTYLHHRHCPRETGTSLTTPHATTLHLS